MKKFHRAWSCSLLVTVACNVEFDRGNEVVDDTHDERPVERAAEPPPPITGGTLHVTYDGAFAVAADPDRNVVHIVDLETNEETATIQLGAGARPFRVIEDAVGVVYLTLRGTGQLIAIDPAAGQIVRTTNVCPNPRGAAYDAERDTTVVACAGGQLVQVDRAGSVVESRFIASDLRDVFVRDGATYVSRFRAAEVLEVQDADAVQDGAPLSLGINGTMLAPATAWRTVPTKEGWVMLHQVARTEPLDASAPGGGEPTPEGGFEEGGAEGYSAGAGPGCGAASSPALSAKLWTGEIASNGPIVGMALAVDVAVHDSDARSSIAVASPSQHDAFRHGTQPVSLVIVDLSLLSPEPFAPCNEPPEPIAEDDFIAVAFSQSGELFAQTRDDPQLYRIVDETVTKVIDLAGDPIVDTGHDLFHLDTGGGIACASCHPEGGDDGRVWAFIEQGPRRTQSLQAGISGTEPFHWRGDMADMHVLVDEVRGRRMAGAELSEDRITALREWVFSIPLPNPERAGADELATQGAIAFTEFGCRTCHAGPAFTSNADADLGMGPLQIPNLRGVALRPPFMHDGRCPTLECATLEMVERTNPSRLGDLGEEQLAAIVAYMQSL